MSESTRTGKEYVEDEEQRRTRFSVELEFVQCLSNPLYLNYLAQNGYFDDEAFIAYLRYLTYWKKPEYSRFICYPHCLRFLDLLQLPTFRKQLVRQEVVEHIHRQQFYHWMHYRNNRIRSANS
mmetsp:Transcript_42391/g.106951  ORF Transcript_42391/g.106951 Transcript_42391/m.106951 type:complete len:123 (-) Transcript_42391:1727-2095(-)